MISSHNRSGAQDRVGKWRAAVCCTPRVSNAACLRCPRAQPFHARRRCLHRASAGRRQHGARYSTTAPIRPASDHAQCSAAGCRVRCRRVWCHRVGAGARHARNCPAAPHAPRCSRCVQSFAAAAVGGWHRTTIFALSCARASGRRTTRASWRCFLCTRWLCAWALAWCASRRGTNCAQLRSLMRCLTDALLVPVPPHGVGLDGCKCAFVAAGHSALRASRSSPAPHTR